MFFPVIVPWRKKEPYPTSFVGIERDILSKAAQDCIEGTTRKRDERKVLKITETQQELNASHWKRFIHNSWSDPFAFITFDGALEHLENKCGCSGALGVLEWALFYESVWQDDIDRAKQLYHMALNSSEPIVYVSDSDFSIIKAYLPKNPND